MSYRLTNEKESSKTVGLNSVTWFGILDLAELYGWQPFGTVDPDWWLRSNGQEECCGSYTGSERRMVLWDDALNLADALEQAFMEYEPVPPWRAPSLSQVQSYYPVATDMPSIGAILIVADLCRQGDFFIEQV